MSTPEFVDELPPTRRTLRPYAELALADEQGRWLKLPYPADNKGIMVQNLKRNYHLEARQIKGVVYCRRPAA
jgi:hypothetical protein